MAPTSLTTQLRCPRSEPPASFRQTGAHFRGQWDEGLAMLDGQLAEHIVVFGIHGVGRRIVKQLSTTGRLIVVVDPEATQEERDELERWDAEYLAGSGQSVDILR